MFSIRCNLQRAIKICSPNEPAQARTRKNITLAATEFTIAGPDVKLLRTRASHAADDPSRLVCALCFVVIAAKHACAQRRGRGAGFGRAGFGRGGYGFSRARAMSPYGFGGYPYMPYDSGADYPYAPQPAALPSRPFLFSSRSCTSSRLRRPSSRRRCIL